MSTSIGKISRCGQVFDDAADRGVVVRRSQPNGLASWDLCCELSHLGKEALLEPTQNSTRLRDRRAGGLCHDGRLTVLHLHSEPKSAPLTRVEILPNLVQGQ